MPFWNRSGKARVPSASPVNSNSTLPETRPPVIDDRGICVLVSPPNPALDIVFVHGLTGNSSTTWREGSSGVVWPRDLLPHDLSRARILTFGYDADVVRAFKISSGNTIRDHGVKLVGEVGRMRFLEECEDRPLIFVVHSLGGLVCEQALLIARSATEPWKNAILSATKGIIFMGTPHAGANLAIWGNVLRRLASIVRRTNRDLLGVLQPGSEMLAALQQEFHIMLQKLSTPGPTSSPSNHSAYAQNGWQRIRIFCFYEEIPYPGIGCIVPSRSAILPGYSSEPICANHRDMTKFANSSQQGYRSVSQQLQIWAKEIDSDIRARTTQSTNPPSYENKTAEGTSVPVKSERQGMPGSRVYSGTINTRHVIQGDMNLHGNLSFG